MPTDKKTSKVIKQTVDQKSIVKQTPVRSAVKPVMQPEKTPTDGESAMTRPLTKKAKKSIKRVTRLFSDIKNLATQSPADYVDASVAQGKKPSVDVERAKFQPPADNTETYRQVKVLISRNLELEAQLRESEKRVAAQTMNAPAKKEAAETFPALTSLYEKEQVGYAYSNENLLPLQMVNFSAEKSEKAIQTPLTASGETIGEMKIEPPSEREWTIEEESLAKSVAQQVSVQIQNLRLLAVTERARAEAQAATRRSTHENWESFLDGIHNSERIGYVYNQAEVVPFAESTPNEHDVQETINVLDEHVGNLFLKADPTRPLTDEDKAMVSAVARQLAQQVENLRLLADASRARANAEEATRRLMRESWQSFTSQHDQAALGFKYDSLQVTPLQADSYPQDISLVQPLSVRGEQIGQLAVAGWKDIPPEAVELVNAIAEKVSAHIENLRLFELNEKRARELGTVAAVSTTASTVLDPDELLQQVVDLTKQRFNLYHAHIYLADKSWNTLLLASGAGEIGRQMVAEGHAIQMDAEKSLVARATRERHAVIVNDVRSEADFLPSVMLPETRAEMAVPMIVGDKVLGVFDVQSDTVGHFTDEDANIYTTLASQIAIALQNARLYMEQSATVVQLRELDRLKSSFLANMSHELRTPLNSILGFADVIIEELDGPLTETMSNDLKLIQKNGQHLLHLINDVLDMAKIESGRMNLNPERFRIHDLLEEVTSITSPLASEKNLALFIENDSDSSVELMADRTRLRQVMINLVNNAMKFTEKGEIRLRAFHHDDLITVRVRDTGVGIPPDKLEVIFQEFTQVDTSTTRKGGGTGLGLPISRRLIEIHGGRLWAESTGVAGEGSTFFVELPIEAIIVDPIEIEKVQR
jgi:signal transduction histidine kinase